jgi:hypothetical protein
MSGLIQPLTAHFKKFFDDEFFSYDQLVILQGFFLVHPAFLIDFLNHILLSDLTVEMVKRRCAFVIKVEAPLQALKTISDFLTDRRIQIETLTMHTLGDGEATLLMHCLVEKDRIKHIQNSLEKMKGILELDLLESRASNLIKIQAG